MEELEKWKVHESPFPIIYVDLTTRCNMKCNFCYMAGREDGHDIDVDYFEDVCKTLPNHVTFRFIGGEPTLHPRFFDIIAIAKKYRHLPTVASNGKKYLDKSFVKEMKKVGGIYSTTLSGGTKNREAYKIIDNEDCLDWKVEAITNIAEIGVRHSVLSSIIMRGLNEDTIGDLREFAEKYPRIFRYLKVRSTLNVGRTAGPGPYTVDEFVSCIQPKYFKGENKLIYSTKTPELIDICKERRCCYYFVYNKFLTVSFVEFGSPNSRLCWKRGKLDNDYNLTKWFEEIHYYGKSPEIQV